MRSFSRKVLAYLREQSLLVGRMAALVIALSVISAFMAPLSHAEVDASILGEILRIGSTIESKYTFAGLSSHLEETGIPVYTVKEIVEVTSDWTDVTWPIGPDVVYSNYSVKQGAEYIDHIELNSLGIWIVQKCLYTPFPKEDCGYIVVEIEAVILDGNSEGQIMIESGDIGYTNVRGQVFDNVTGLPVGVFAVTCRDPAVTARGKKAIFDLDISDFYLFRSGALFPEESLRVRDLEILRLEDIVENSRSIVIIVAIIVAIIFWILGYFTHARKQPI
jgi:hypothetical protein